MSNSRYLQCFDDAFIAYQNQEKRPGYTPGWFSWLRHNNGYTTGLFSFFRDTESPQPYPHIAELRKNLNDSKSESEAINALKRYFLNPKTTYNNHSFASYLLDILMRKDIKNNWEQFLPSEKKYVFYTGTLYRGMKIDQATLNDFFTNGLSSLEHSPRIEEYANPNSLSLGLSTSKEFSVALKYASTHTITKGENRHEIIIPGYLLEFDYPGYGGIDIVETYKMRNDSYNQQLANPKQEVNIIGKIPPENIKGAYFVNPCNRNENNPFIANPNYKKSESNSFFPNISLRLQHLFNPTPPPFAPNKARVTPTPPPFAPNHVRVKPPLPTFAPNNVQFRIKN